MELNDLHGISQLVESLKIIRIWNDSMLSRLDECVKASDSDSIPVVDELVNICEPLFEEIEKTQMVRESLTRYMDNIRALRATLIRSRGMATLPLEVVGNVFAMASQTDHKTALSITHACREWRRAALATPVMWMHVHFDHRTNYSVDLLRMYLERSGRVPLWIEYYPCTDESYRASVSLLLEHANRWYDLRAETDQVVPMLRQMVDALPAPVILPKLTTLNLTSCFEWVGRRFPPIHLPAIQCLCLASPYRGFDPCSVGPGLTSIDICPISLADFTSCTGLCEVRWTIREDLVIEQGLQLDLPNLEAMDLEFAEGDWTMVGRVFHAMASCHPRRLEIRFLEDMSERIPDGQPLEPPSTLLSRVVDLEIRTRARRRPHSTLSDINVEQILLKTDMLRTLNICGVVDIRSLLQRMAVNTFAPRLHRLRLIGGHQLIDEIRHLLVCRREQGLPSLEDLILLNCGKRSEEAIAQLQKLVQKLKWDW